MEQLSTPIWGKKNGKTIDQQFQPIRISINRGEKIKLGAMGQSFLGKPLGIEL